jgi:hypothetical protein
MKSRSFSNSRMVFAALGGLAIATGVVVFRAQADQWDKKTILTVDQPIQVRDKLLEPGKYVFRLLDSSSDRHVVQIFDGDQSHLVDTVLAIPRYRQEPSGKSQFTFWETPPGSARALRTWFYPGDSMGQEFPYPKQLAMLETPASAPAPGPPPAETTPAEPPQAAPEEPQPQSMTQEPQRENQPVEMAQNNPPPAPPAEPQPAPREREAETLPKTASPFPLVGLSGLLSAGLYGLLRLKRAA